MLAQPCIDKRIGPQFCQPTVPGNGPFDWLKASGMNAHGPLVSHYPNANSISDPSVLHGRTLGPNLRSRNAAGPNRTPVLVCGPGWVWELQSAALVSRCGSHAPIAFRRRSDSNCHSEIAIGSTNKTAGDRDGLVDVACYCNTYQVAAVDRAVRRIVGDPPGARDLDVGPRVSRAGADTGRGRTIEITSPKAQAAAASIRSTARSRHGCSLTFCLRALAVPKSHLPRALRRAD